MSVKNYMKRVLSALLLGAGATAQAQDYRFTAGVHLNNSWGKDQYARKIGDWTADNRSSNIGVDIGVKSYPWLSTKHFVYIGGRFSVQHSDRELQPEAIAGFDRASRTDFGFSWGTWSVVGRYGHRVDWSYKWSTAFTAGLSLGVQHGFTYTERYRSGTAPQVTERGNSALGDRFLSSSSIMPAAEFGVEFFPLGSNRRVSVTCLYVQQLIPNTASQALVSYEHATEGIKREYGYNSRVRYASIMVGLHCYLGKLSSGVRVNKSNRNDCTSI